jgi:HK97 family phage portal protein
MAYVVTSGQLQSVERANDFRYNMFTGSSAVTLTPSVILTYEQLWRAQPALRTVTGFLARNVASLPMDVYERVSVTDRARADTHPLTAILERPLYGSTWTKYRLLNTLMHDLCIFDSAYWLKIFAPGRRLVGLLPIPPRMVSPIGADAFITQRYRITGNAGWREYPARDLVHFHGYNPDDPRTGVAPVETLRQILAEEHSAAVHREQMWRNGARVTGYLTRPEKAPRWTAEGRARFRADWQAQYAGDGPATGGTPVLEDGMNFVASSITPRDAQYVEARKLTREEVAVAFHVNPAMLGLMEGATQGSLSEIHKMLYQDTLPPWMSQIVQDIEVQVLDDLDPAARDGRVYVEFNLKGKLNGSFVEQASALQSAVGGPWMTRDEARGMHNLPHVDGADELIVPLNVVTGGLASPNDTAPDEPDNGPSNGQLPKTAVALFQDFFARQAKTAASRLGANATATATDLLPADRWDSELAIDLARAGLTAPVAAINDATRAAIATALTAPAPMGALASLFADYVANRAPTLAMEVETS